MSDWKPKPSAFIDQDALDISREDQDLLARIDGNTSVKDLAAQGNLAPARVRSALTRLVDEGLLEADGAPPEILAPPEDVAEKTVIDARPDLALLLADEGGPTMEVPPALEVRGPTSRRPRDPVEEDAPPPLAPEPQPEPVDPETEQDPGQDGAAPAGNTPEVTAADEANYRKLFETTLHDLTVDERTALAQKVTGAQLMALCYDPHPGVIRAVIENATSGLAHARLIASAHHSSAGLDHLARRAEFLRDAQLQRRLLCNLHLPESLFKRITATKPLGELFKLTTNRDLTEKSRNQARVAMRTRFNTAPSEERVDVIFRTEGRVLPMLTGLTLDSHAATLMCRRTYTSVLLIQNLARFPACPPQVLSHLLHQPLVKRQANLRTMLLQHPNMPSDAKRRAT
jgi:hypothetical protein